MEVYKDISNTQNQQFQKLLIDNFQKLKSKKASCLQELLLKLPKNMFIY